MKDWKTTLSGWLTVICAGIAAKPELVAFLPEENQKIVTGVAGIVAAIAGATFATVAKDAGKSVCVVGFGVMMLCSGCAWSQAHRGQISQTLAIARGKAIEAAQGVLINAAADRMTGHADWLDSIASGIRTQGASISARDVADIVAIWAPNAGKWQKLGANLSGAAEEALKISGNTKAALVAEGIAQGLNDTAANVRGGGK